MPPRPFVRRTIEENIANALSTHMPIAKIKAPFHTSQRTIEIVHQLT
jgi:hypothetical protein